MAVRKIRAGMRATTRIKTGDRRAIEDILSPVVQAAKEAGREAVRQRNGLRVDRRRSGGRSKWPLLLIGALLLGGAYSYLNEKILPVEKIDSERWGSPENAERYFNRPIPTAQDIKLHLSNATLVVSDPPGGNAVYYFDAPYHFLKWRNLNTPAGDVFGGTWSIEWHLLPMELNGRWRVAVEYVICTRSPDSLPADVPFCQSVGNLTPLLRFGRNQEYRSGNVFNLSADGDVPFPLPTGVGISVDSLLPLKKTQNRQ